MQACFQLCFTYLVFWVYHVISYYIWVYHVMLCSGITNLDILAVNCIFFKLDHTGRFFVDYQGCQMCHFVFQVSKWVLNTRVTYSISCRGVVIPCVCAPVLNRVKAWGHWQRPPSGNTSIRGNTGTTLPMSLTLARLYSLWNRKGKTSGKVYMRVCVCTGLCLGAFLQKHCRSIASKPLNIHCSYILKFLIVFEIWTFSTLMSGFHCYYISWAPVKTADLWVASGPLHWS